MLKEGQLIEIVWSSKTKEHYITHGYKFTHNNSPLIVQAEHLIESASKTVVLICDRCGEEYKGVWAGHCKRVKNGKPDYCRKCAVYSQHRRKREQDFQTKINFAYEICDEKDYEPITTDIELNDSKDMLFRYRCKKHGEQCCLMTNFLKKHGCYFCGREQVANKQRNDPDYVESVINSVNNNTLINKEEYIGSNIHNLRIMCGKCGTHEFVTSFSDYYNCGKVQCRSCSSQASKGEQAIADYLDNLKIEYVREKKYPDCKDKKCLPFDFYLPDYDMIIEFDGPHHYYPVFSEKQFDMIKRHDKIKDDFCYSKGISILRIPYWEGKNIDSILNNTLCCA